MCKRKAFTLIELLMVIAIIALLLSILMPALQRVKRQARAAACMTNLKQWALILSMHTDEHNGRFHKGLAGGHHRTVVLRPYFSDPNDTRLFCCPSATKHIDDVGQWGNDTAWVFDSGMGRDHGSYGTNGFVETNTRQGEHKHWKSRDVRGAAEIPLFLASNRLDGWPEAWDEPPSWDGQFNTGQGDNIRRFCMDRHTGSVNCLFLDFSVSKVGLKGLWKLRWHREWTRDISSINVPV
ncbi:MAG: prepilin-type N-terminal cleavage/methylation domain-containing protein [Phycisphaerales bacterium]|nr:MAG: prepilin-type N-terminal cleavage/methylation domain-containing protein [Phycisphaerales bacterium]